MTVAQKLGSYQSLDSMDACNQQPVFVFEIFDTSGKCVG
jgi:hypothetical protein